MIDPNSVPLVPAGDPALREDAAGRLWRLWQQGPRPDVATFVAQVGPLSPAELAAVLRVDQRERWQAGERVLAEDYLRYYPAIREHADQAVDLIYAEFLLREHRGEQPALDDYLRRFPEHAAVLQAQIELHAAMAGETNRTTAQALQPWMQALVGDTVHTEPPAQVQPGWPTVPGYDILGVLGQGGMGVVYLAQDRHLLRRVALKMPHFPAGDQVACQRFLREARAAAALNHPNICPVHEYGETEGRPYLVMAYVEGRSLEARVRDGQPLPQRQAADLVRQIARALHEAHRRGILHRDLKPGNILLNAQEQPIVMDFGLAKQVAPAEENAASALPTASLTESGVIVGTPAYLSPEQAACGPQPLGPGTDIYSLGVILYKLLTGGLPFAGSIGHLLAQIQRDPPPPPSRFRPDLDPALGAVCLKALAKQPEDRYASMADFAAALDAFCGEAPPARTPRRRWAVLLAALTVVVLLGFALRGLGPLFSTPRAAEDSALADINLDTDSPTRHVDLAWHYLDVQSDPDRAMDACAKALQRDPGFTRAFHCRGHAWMKKGQFVRAKEDFSRAIGLDPDYVEALSDRAWACNELREHQKAIDDCTQAIARQENWHEAYQQRAEAYFALGKYDLALKDSTRAIELQPNNVWAEELRAKAAAKLKKPGPAATDKR